VLYAGVYSFLSVCQLFSSIFIVILNLHQPINEAQIYFVFCAWVNPNALWANRVGFVSSLLKLWFERGSWGFGNVLTN